MEIVGFEFLRFRVATIGREINEHRDGNGSDFLIVGFIFSGDDGKPWIAETAGAEEWTDVSKLGVMAFRMEVVLVFDGKEVSYARDANKLWTGQKKVCSKKSIPLGETQIDR